MTKKTYAPVQLKNPTSMRHQTFLRPGQELVLKLDFNTFEQPKVTLVSDFYHETGCEQVADGYEYRYAPNRDLSEWSMYSVCHLGDIWIDSEFVTARAILLQTCCNDGKDNQITTINPNAAELKLLPHSVLEVVLYNTDNWYTQWAWDWIRTPNSEIKVEEIGQGVLTASGINNNTYDHPDHFFARMPRQEASNIPIVQNHFWFRFEKGVLESLDNIAGWRYVGDIRLFGRCYGVQSKDVERHVSIYLKPDLKYREATLKTLAIRPQSETTKPAYVLYPPSATYKKAGGQIGWQRKVPKLQIVTLVQLTGELTDGCRTVPAILPKPTHPVASRHEVDDYDLALDDCMGCDGSDFYKHRYFWQ